MNIEEYLLNFMKKVREDLLVPVKRSNKDMVDIVMKDEGFAYRLKDIKGHLEVLKLDHKLDQKNFNRLYNSVMMMKLHKEILVKYLVKNELVKPFNSSVKKSSYERG